MLTCSRRQWRGGGCAGFGAGKQLYLLGSYWIIKEKPIMDAVQCGRPCEEIDRDTAGKHFQIGPPHFMAAADWRTVAPRWTQYALGFWDRYKVSQGFRLTLCVVRSRFFKLH